MQRLWRKEDNNTSKQHSPGKRKEGGEPASKGLQHKVKKELRQRSCKTLSLWDSEKWRRNLAHSQQMLLQKPWETLPYLDSWAWTFLSGRRSCPAPAALQPGLTQSSTHHEEINPQVFFPNTVLSRPSIFPTCQTLCVKYWKKATCENNEIHETVTDNTKMQH